MTEPTIITWKSQPEPIPLDERPLILNISTSGPQKRFLLRTPLGNFDLSCCVQSDMQADMPGDDYSILSLHIPLFLVDIQQETQ